jgi:molecular chaperone GrpE
MSDEQTPAEAANEAPAEAPAGEAEALRAEVAALKEQVLRYAADAENTRRRAERESNDARAYAIQKFARDLLGVADNLARAMQATPASEDPTVKNFVVGVELTAKELQQAFERNGLRKLEPGKGDKFDPNLHQAMLEQPATDVPGGSVIQTLQPGYDLFGRIVRPAMVVVAAKSAAAEPPAAEAGSSNPYAAAEGDDAGAAVDRRA